MMPTWWAEKTGANQLRHIVQVMGNVRESFNDRFTVSELIKIYTAHQLCGWDFYPDQWEALQVTEALQGIIPDWTDWGDRRGVEPHYAQNRFTARLMRSK